MSTCSSFSTTIQLTFVKSWHYEYLMCKANLREYCGKWNRMSSKYPNVPHIIYVRGFSYEAAKNNSNACAGFNQNYFM